MKLYPHRTPLILRKLFPQLLWKMGDQSNAPSIYLTFDDGPEPGLTDYVLEVLDQFSAKATFFVIGDKVQKYARTLEKVVNESHAIGNHTFSHIDGWKTSVNEYKSNIEKCNRILSQNGITTTLFRPPFGRIPWALINESAYINVMWNYLSGDFDLKLNHLEAKRSMLAADSGSIVVFHDNPRFEKNLKPLLPWFLEEFASRGYTFKALPQNPQ